MNANIKWNETQTNNRYYKYITPQNNVNSANNMKYDYAVMNNPYKVMTDTKQIPME